ncbi:MAG: phospholipid carrier-dependent glycosyltransferase [Nitrososphaeria archaeon]|nr:phospholipid carrier-dependent glycosyltransferase [Nitrososphaeria archaeon]NIQ32782.1 phospholipid carrier-dependent glycosyltransferase [Nitrososphaeria archaeon]
MNEPEQIYFDEVHYVEAARSVLGGLGDPNWQHPPLAKLLISGGVWLWGDNSWGWRLPGALLGILCVPLMFLIGERMYGSRRIGLSAALLLAFDFMFFVQSRIAMLDIFVLAFSLLGLYFFLSSDRYGWSYAILSGFFFGLAVSSKISGSLVILTCLIFSASGVRRRGGRDFLRLLTALIFLPMLVYVASHIPILSLSLLSPEVFLSYQTRLLKYSATMVEVHPYMSEPWTWPLMSRPLLYLYDNVKIGDLLYVATVSALGNPLTWYVGFGVILATFPRVLRQRRWDFSFLWFLLTWLPFFPIGIAHTFFSGGRPMFIYYFLQSVPPLIFCLTRYLEDVDDVLGIPVSVLFILSALVGFIISYPVISAYPVSQEYVRGMGTLRLRL